MKIDLSDVLISLCVLLVGVGLFFLAWPLVPVAVGLVAGYIGVRRA